MINSGLLRHRVTIQKLTTAQVGLDTTETWTDFATVWASIEDLSGREYFAAQQVNSEVNTRIRIRYLPGVTPAMQAVSSGRTYDIKAVLDSDGRRRELQLMAVDITEKLRQLNS